MPKYAYFLLCTGVGSLPTLMQRLMTGYQVSFNRRQNLNWQTKYD